MNSNRAIVMYGSLGFAIFLLIIGIILKIHYFDILTSPIAAIAILLIGALTPYGFYEYSQGQKIIEMERRLPDLLRDIAEYSNFGLPVSQALIRAGNNEYGHLTPLIKSIADKISAGTPVEEAVSSSEAEIHSQVIKRAFTVLRKATESGNNVSEVLRLISEFTAEIEVIREGRISEMKNFVLVMYVAFAVFFFVVLAIDLAFLPKVAESNFSPLGFSAQTVSSSTIERIFSGGIIVQGGSTGLMSGILKDGSFGTGAFFTGITLLVTVVALGIFGVL